MRPLTVNPIAGVPPFIQGLAVIRGAPIPVVHAASLLCGEPSRPTRFVTIKVGARRIALAVDAVLGVIDLPPATVGALEPLLQNGSSDAVSAAGALDGELLLVLRSARLIPDGVWAALQTAATAA